MFERFRRMRREIDRGAESLERKLRYLFWVNGGSTSRGGHSFGSVR